MCICINCRHVHSCSIYKIIKKQHKHQTENGNSVFTPKNTLITVNINSSCNEIDWDLIECLSFTEKPGSWLSIR
uniref:hypothetical protein n=1 Tax=Ahnfeltia fastigiata TaxID=31363 RepID=UPI001D117EE8|nr:hypothetical protein LK038_pgp204 [Ahnfeltia fastigiata]UAT97683.1 hypothetical protein Ahn.fas.Ore.pt_006 [Ahnfeltia fastigiata]